MGIDLPRPGYVSVSVTREAKRALDDLKEIIGAETYSDLIISMNEMYREILDIMFKTNSHLNRGHLKRYYKKIQLYNKR